MKLGEILNKVRTDKNMSIEEVSKLTGVSTAQIWRIEKGDGNPKLDTIKKIFNAFDISLAIVLLMSDLGEDLSKKTALKLQGVKKIIENKIDMPWNIK